MEIRLAGRNAIAIFVIAANLAACGSRTRRAPESQNEPRPPEERTQSTEAAPSASSSSPRDRGTEPAPAEPDEVLADRRPRASDSSAADRAPESTDRQPKAIVPSEADGGSGSEPSTLPDESEAGAPPAPDADRQPELEASASEPAANDETIAPAEPAPAMAGELQAPATQTPVAPATPHDAPSPAAAESGVASVTPTPDADAASTGEIPALLPDDAAATDASAHFTELSSPSPVDYAGTFWLGDGYDALSGARRASCLDGAKVELRSYPVNQSYDTLELVLNRDELSRKLDVAMNAEASGAWNGITASASVKASILRETEISNSSFVALARFRFLKNRVSLYQSIAPLHPDRLADLMADKALFREECGDKFTRSVRLGAELILVITAQQIKSTQHSATQVTEALKVGFGAAFSVNQSTSLTRDQKQILDNFHVSTRCYTNGASPLPCVDNGLNISGASFGDATTLERINGAKRSLAAEIAAGNNLVVLDEELERYPVPAAARGQTPEQVFVDYSPQLRNIQAWLRLESRIQLICDSLPDLEAACYEARQTLAAAIDACADSSQWPRGQCRAPQDQDLAFIKAQSDAGSITVYEHGSRRGRSLTLTLHDLFDRDSKLKPGLLYDLGEQRFGWFVDILSSADAFLKNGWQVVFYEHPDGSGRTWTVDPRVQGYTDAARGFNDQASAFRLVRVDH